MFKPLDTEPMKGVSTAVMSPAASTFNPQPCVSAQAHYTVRGRNWAPQAGITRNQHAGGGGGYWR